MLKFKFSGKDKFNNSIRGTVEAESLEEAHNALNTEGYHFISLSFAPDKLEDMKTFYFEAKNRFNRKISGEIDAINLTIAYQRLVNELYSEIVISEKPFTTNPVIPHDNFPTSNCINLNDVSKTQKTDFVQFDSLAKMGRETINTFSNKSVNHSAINNARSVSINNTKNNINIPDKKNISSRSPSFWLIIGFCTKSITFNVLFIKLAIELNRARSNYDQRYTYTALPIIGIFMDIFLMGLAKEPTPVEYWPSWIWVMLIIYVGVNIYWFQTFCDRIRDELYRRKIAFNYSSSYYWLLSFIPTVITFIVGNWFEKTLVDSLIGNTNDMSTLMFLLIIIIVLLPIKYSFYYLTIKAMNLINEDYNSGRNN